MIASTLKGTASLSGILVQPSGPEFKLHLNADCLLGSASLEFAYLCKQKSSESALPPPLAAQKLISSLLVFIFMGYRVEATISNAPDNITLCVLQIDKGAGHGPTSSRIRSCTESLI